MKSCVISFKKSDLKMWCLSALIFFCVFENTYISSFVSYSGFQKILGIGIIAVLLILGGVNGRITVSRNLILVAVFYLWILCLTYFNNGFENVYSAVNAFYSSVVVYIFCHYFSYDDEKVMAILDAWKCILLVLVIIDLLSQIMYPEGLYASQFDSYNWFLGYKTTRVLYSLPMCMMFFYTSMRRKGKISSKCWIILLISVYDAFLSQATAASAALAVAGILAFLENNKFFGKVTRKILNIKFWYICYFVLTCLIVVSQSANLLVFFASMFGKTVTFSGRTVIWLNCVNSIISSKGIGVGYLVSEQYATLTHWLRGTNAHNQVLGLLVTGGVVAFSIYYFLIYKAAKHRNYIKDVILVFVYGMMILGITSDTFTYSTFGFFMIWLLDYSDRYVDTL